jgi:hypothetical protein
VDLRDDGDWSPSFAPRFGSLTPQDCEIALSEVGVIGIKESCREGNCREAKLTTIYWRSALIASSTFVASSEAIAQGTATPPANLVATQILAILFVCGLMGVVGQGCRTIVGLTNMAMYKIGSQPGQQDLFNLSRLIFSLIVGFLAGFVAVEGERHRSYRCV